MAIKQLRCYCDHCANNTCTTSQLCYAEWKLVTTNGPSATLSGFNGDNKQPLQSSTFATTTASSATQSATATLAASQAALSSATNTTISNNNTNQQSITSAISTTPLENHNLYHQQQQQIASQLLASNLRLEKSYNCFKKDDPLLIRTVCHETATNTSHVIRRCCHSGDYCNKDESLLPSEAEALAEIRKYLPVVEPSRQAQTRTTNNIFSDFYEQYSTLPLGLQITLLLLTILLLAYIIALVQNTALARRSRRRRGEHHHRHHHRHRATTTTSSTQGNAFKRVLNRILFSFGRRTSTIFGGSPGRFSGGDSSTRHDSPQQQQTSEPSSRSRGHTVHHVPSPKNASPQSAGQSGGIRASSRLAGTVDDFSEYSSSKANSEMTVFDTNSMASREPLISGQSRRMHIHSGSQHPYQAPALNQQHPGPYMAEETYNGRTQTTFQMTLGSAAGLQYKQETSSGSGAGQPYLTQRSIAHDIELCEVVGRGFFGVVWRGEYKGEPVAVKIFSPVAEPSWEREAEIYQTTMLRHKNILGFIATDKRHDAALTGYWLVTDYYAMGSLYDFLKDNTMSMSDAIRMAFSIANGLSHLHIEIFGTRGKPAIAHRDIKSKNILVKNDGTCCIADLGMAVRYNSNTGIVDVPTNTRIGTRRYLAPEILENKLNLMDFESVKATDIYALGLVLWEIIRRACLTQPDFDANGYATNTVLVPAQPAAPRQPAVPYDRPGFEGTSGSGALSATEHSEHPAGPQIPLGASVEATAAAAATASGAFQAQQQQQQQQQQSQPLLDQPAAGGQQQQPPPHPQMQQGMRQLPHHQSFMTNESLDTTLDDVNNDLALVCEPYEAPYQPYVPMDPTAEDMRQVVCVRKIRPGLSPRWSKFASMRDYVTLMTECWYDKPQSRLSALRVRKSLSDVARKYFNLYMEYD